MMTERQARDIVALIQAAYPRHPWPQSTVAFFASELQRAGEFEVVVGVVRSMLRTRAGDFPPALSELLGAIADASTGIPSFEYALMALREAAVTCDYFSSEPPQDLHPAARELGRQLGWEDFRFGDHVGDTYYEHTARQRYEQIVLHARSRVVEGLPAWESPAELPSEVRGLVEGIGEES